MGSPCVSKSNIDRAHHNVSTDSPFFSFAKGDLPDSGLAAGAHAGVAAKARADAKLYAVVGASGGLGIVGGLTAFVATLLGGL